MYGNLERARVVAREARNRAYLAALKERGARADRIREAKGAPPKGPAVTSKPVRPRGRKRG